MLGAGVEKCVGVSERCGGRGVWGSAGGGEGRRMGVWGENEVRGSVLVRGGGEGRYGEVWEEAREGV